ncbi:ATP-dependent DNA ligase [Pseudorhodobacter sp. E13]|uniref:ATP-dependent DNA ligase n=1 Tax=Pseudorhodobacter sp. E13 TaxID=2487931 RepID=UPI000F8EB9F3|nr:ATP-dependent DNA ligase [Pseudorhodobacter sp. E13]RUS63242.1 ATP-dependent DNA ligase [Pseudorhodobacter sp. E13]
MNRFAQLFNALDATTKTSAKTAALAAYFQTAPKSDRVWTIALLSGRRPKRAASSTQLRDWAAEAAGLPLWMVEESYPIVGDLAETIALLLPAPQSRSNQSLTGWIETLIALTDQPPEAKRAGVLAAWDSLETTERFLFNKLITGGFRMGVSRGLMTRALAQATGVDESLLAHRLMGNWNPATTDFDDLIAETDLQGSTKPYPFALASGLEDKPETLGPRAEWLAEWKWDGIRGQIINRPGAFALWSRGEELITDRFPEFAPLARALPQGTVLDGEVLVWSNDAPLPFALLQKRITRKTVPKKLLAEAPARFLAYDLLEWQGRDLRAAPLADRRAALMQMLAQLPPGLPLAASAAVTAPDWTTLTKARHTAREKSAEGLMLKRLASPYHAGRKRGDWWKWKLDPYTVDAVMLYAQSGHGRRANLFTDFTFAVRDGDALVPFTKAYSGLTDAEFRQITDWVKKHTIERFGPVRRVPPELVFEIAFEGIAESPRHKSGIALRFPRMLRWRHDKPVEEIDTLDSLRALLP